MMLQIGSLLEKINYPSDLKKLKEDELPQLCEELRQFIIDAVSKNPGHLGASLGAVELAVAIHYVFDTPNDMLVWDVGHQAYPHKILTGRKNKFYSNRSYQGISGFPRRTESEYDSFGTGHSSTSISAVLGMAVASAQDKNYTKQHIAVIGDGSLTGGMAFEALNHAGVSNTNIIIIINDNNIAIDQNVGALKEYLTDITTSHTYNKVKDEVWTILGSLRRVGGSTRALFRKIGVGLKSTLLKHSNLFEALNLRYFGPLDGHDVIRLVRILTDLKDIQGPKILHTLTVKGKGFEQAEKNQTKWHAPGFFNKDTGEILESADIGIMPPKFQDVFGNTLVELAELNPNIVGITPAMASGCSMNFLMEKMPDRAFDVGIAEQHAVTFSAGLAVGGKLPFCNIYSSFLQRAYDQIIHDIALQKLNVVLCLDRAGLVGEDGPTHHGVFDLAYLRCIPNMTIASPINEEELRNLMFTAQQKNMGPFAIRYPRGHGVMPNWKKPFKLLEIGKGKKLKDGNDIAIISIGAIGNNVIKAYDKIEKDGISLAHYDIRFLKPIDTILLHEIFKKYKKIITIEDATINGGLGSAVIEFMADNEYHSVVKRMGVPDRFIEHGKLHQLQRECGFHSEGIYCEVKEFVSEKVLT